MSSLAYNTDYRGASTHPATLSKMEFTHMPKDKDIKYIPLTKGFFATVDAGDYEWLSQWKWCISTLGYAMRGLYLGGGAKNPKNKTIWMHRFIMNTPKELFTDHINMDKLDNRRCNLRVCTKSENAYNQKPRKQTTSQYKGVHFFTQMGHLNKPWLAYITVNKKRTYLGYYKTEEEAALAYNIAAMKYHGNFAKLNSLPL